MLILGTHNLPGPTCSMVMQIEPYLAASNQLRIVLKHHVVHPPFKLISPSEKLAYLVNCFSRARLVAQSNSLVFEPDRYCTVINLEPIANSHSVL